MYKRQFRTTRSAIQFTMDFLNPRWMDYRQNWKESRIDVRLASSGKWRRAKES